jgi:hypothetical protein
MSQKPVHRPPVHRKPKPGAVFFSAEPTIGGVAGTLVASDEPAGDALQTPVEQPVSTCMACDAAAFRASTAVKTGAIGKDSSEVSFEAFYQRFDPRYKRHVLVLPHNVRVNLQSMFDKPEDTFSGVRFDTFFNDWILQAKTSKFVDNDTISSYIRRKVEVHGVVKRYDVESSSEGDSFHGWTMYIQSVNSVN